MTIIVWSCMALQGLAMTVGVTAAARASSATPAELRAFREEISRLSDELAQNKKDNWDRLAAISPLIGGVLVAAIGGFATYVFNKRQRAAEDARAQRALDAENERKHHELAILRIQTLQAFLPDLRSEDERSKEAAVLAITSLGDTELMTRVTELFRGPGVVTALTKVATRSTGETAALAVESVRQVMAALGDAVIMVRSQRDHGPVSGSGFVAAPGLVVTVDYVVPTPGNARMSEDAKATSVLFSDGREEDATVLEVDGLSHVALLRTDTRDIVPLPLLTDDSGSQPGTMVLVLGYAGSMQEGKISVGSVLGLIEKSELAGIPLLVVNVATQPGFSGAPVVNTSGQVVGIHHARSSGSEPADQRYLIPATAVAAIVARSTVHDGDSGGSDSGAPAETAPGRMQDLDPNLEAALTEAEDSGER